MGPIPVTTTVHPTYKPQVKFPGQRILIDGNGLLQNPLDVFSHARVSQGDVSRMARRRE